MKPTPRTALFLSVALAALAPALPAAAQDVLVYGRVADARSLDPGLVTDANSSVVLTQMFETLLTTRPGSDEVIPWLAERYEVSADLTEITFHLRPGVTFHDGTPMNADAVVFSLMRQHDAGHPFHDVGRWRFWSARGFAGRDGAPGVIDTIEALDDMTVRVRLNRPDVTVTTIGFLAYQTGIVSPAAVERLGAEFANNPVGTGPFRFGQWQRDSAIVLERNDAYWGEPAGVDQLVFRIYPDDQARMLALRSGEVDIIDPVGPEGTAALATDPAVRLEENQLHSVGFLALNTETGPFTDVNLRRAFCRALNRDEIRETVYGQTGRSEDQPMPSTIWAYDPTIEGPAYDPARARALIAEAGVVTPVDLDVIYLPAYRSYNPNGRRVGEILQAQLADVGMNANLLTFDMGTYFDRMDAGQFDVAMAGWFGQSDPDDWLYTLFTDSFLNTPRWRNPEFIDLVTRARETADREARRALYGQAMRILMDQAPVCVLARGVEYVPMSTRVQGWVNNPNGRRNFALVHLAD